MAWSDKLSRPALIRPDLALGMGRVTLTWPRPWGRSVSTTARWPSLLRLANPASVCAIALGAGSMRSPTATKRTIYFPGGRKRSVALEDAFWEGLKEIAQRRGMTVSDLIGEINAQRQRDNLSSALLEFYRSQIPDPPR